MRECEYCGLDISWKVWSKSKFCCSNCSRKQYYIDNPDKLYDLCITQSVNMRVETHIKHMKIILKAGGTLG